jgi:Xaa-Pro aminopeptidase
LYVASGIKVLDVSLHIYGQMDPLSEAIEKSGTDAYVMYASSRDADMRYLTKFITSDPFVYFKKPGENGTIIVSQMEVLRASRESPAAVMTRAEAGLPEILKKEKDLTRATAKMIAGQAGKKILVPPQFPTGLARALENHCSVSVDSGTVLAMRAKKTKTEITEMRRVQKVTETALGLGVALIRKSRARKGILYVKGQPLTAEQVKFAMHSHLLSCGCTAVDTIVSCGEETAIPHMTGSGPLRSDEPIIIDLFPVEESSGYYADMTRTVVKGEPSEEIRTMYETLREAKQLGISLIKPKVLGSDVYQAVVDFFAERGYESDTRGFVHSLGHGVGLQVHELPNVGPAGKALATGNVITVEPGLYYPGTGGVRIEDMGVITARGFDNFTQFTEELIL